jgi:YVTN family beta-propeller protein
MASTIPVGIFPLAVTVSPDGARAYVTNTFSNGVSVIDTASDTVIATVPVIEFPIAVIVSPDSSRVYVANFSSQKMVSVIDAASNTVIASISVGSFPDGLVLTPNGKKLYCANNLDGTVSVVEFAMGWPQQVCSNGYSTSTPRCSSSSSEAMPTSG